MQNGKKRLSVSSFLSACLSAPTGSSFMKFYIRLFFENLSRNFKFHLNLRIITGTSNDDICTFIIYLAEFFLE